jgi:hypothetical protein
MKLPVFRLKKNPNKHSLEDKYQKAIHHIKMLKEKGDLLENSGWAKMKSPKNPEIDSSFRVNKIGATVIDRANFLR